MNHLPALLICAAALCACSRRPAPVPRPRAYPRIDVPQARYDTLSIHGAGFAVNSAARAHTDGDALTIAYPGGIGTLYCTFTPVTAATREAVASNRTERLSLNTGGARTATTTLERGPWKAVLMETPAGTPTPVQFLATGPDLVVSGSLYMDLPRQWQPDSIMPAVQAVARDLKAALELLLLR